MNPSLDEVEDNWYRRKAVRNIGNSLDSCSAFKQTKLRLAFFVAPTAYHKKFWRNAFPFVFSPQT